MRCADCKQKPKNRCQEEGFDCTGGKLDLSDYNLEENRDLQNISDILRRIHGNQLSRLEEIIEFSKEAGFKRIGLSFCTGLKDEATLVSRILDREFKVDSVICKLGGLDKDDYGMARINDGKCEIACNPIGQAKMLNKAKTDLNIQIGLCLGHDILFQKYSDAPVTVLVVKDRILANNPMGVVYGSYWRKRLKI
ncbi:MAG: DUF1847 domain-containing protein [Thermodesulfobacteriota bacterium]